MSSTNPSSVRPVTAATFETDVLDRDLPVIVDFWAEWCGPCTALSPILEQIAQANAGRVEIVSVDVDRERELAARYGVISLPSIKVFRAGEVVTSITGAKPRPVLEAALAEHLG